MIHFVFHNYLERFASVCALYIQAWISAKYGHGWLLLPPTRVTCQCGRAPFQRDLLKKKSWIKKNLVVYWETPGLFLWANTIQLSSLQAWSWIWSFLCGGAQLLDTPPLDASTPLHAYSNHEWWIMIPKVNILDAGPYASKPNWMWKWIWKSAAICRVIRWPIHL